MAISLIAGFDLGPYESYGSGGTPASTTGRDGLAIVTGSTSYVISRSAGGSYRSVFQSFRMYVKFGATCSAKVRAGFADASSSTNGQGWSYSSITGLITITNSSGVTAATSLLTAPNDGAWHRVDFDAGYSSGTGVRVLVDGTEYASSSSATVVVGNCLAIVSASASPFDDLVGYDSALPATLNDYNVNLLLPTSDTAIGNWKRNDGTTTTSLYTAVDNTPPTGTAVTSTLAANYVQNGTAGSSSVNDNLDLTCATYDSITGLTSASQILGVMAICSDAQQVTTGSPKSGAVALVTPSTSDQSFDCGFPNGLLLNNSAAAQGAFPVGWGTHTGAVASAPSVTVSNGPVVRVKRTGTYTRVISVDFLGAYVMWEAAAAAKSLPFPSHRLNPAMFRR